MLYLPRGNEPKETIPRQLALRVRSRHRATLASVMTPSGAPRLKRQSLAILPALPFYAAHQVGWGKVDTLFEGFAHLSHALHHTEKRKGFSGKVK